MKVAITQRIYCALTIPDGKSLRIDNFIFRPDFEGQYQANHIQTIVEANTVKEAKIKANKMFNDFLSKLTLIDNSKYVLENQLSVNVVGSNVTSHTVSISTGGFIIQDGNNIKQIYESNYIKKPIRKTPLRLYRDAINSTNPFDKYRDFYKVLECYGGTGDITTWIKRNIRKPIIKRCTFRKKPQVVTIFTWIRHRLSHTWSKRGGVKPLLLSNPKHVFLVQKYLPKIQKLARKKIKEMEKI